jgi:hypothetical protein
MPDGTAEPASPVQFRIDWNEPRLPLIDLFGNVWSYTGAPM